MIYNRDESEVTVLGDVEKYKVSIDEKNINHIVTILSSNLYSNPLRSFLRETVSNAVDSHVEAGVDEPIIITRTYKDISIRDYGTGISPQRFQEIYLNIGSSTKRESNDYIGQFGLGRFSCLSVSKLANITSFYEGKAYYYVMNKDIDQLHVDKLYELDTEEPNGVEVKIPLTSFDTGELECLGFIPNVYVEDEVPDDRRAVNNFNTRKIGIHKSFKLSSLKSLYSSDTEVLVGNIPYRVNLSDFLSYDEYKDWKRTFQMIYPCVEIGSVDITPNRESLLYSERTKEALRKAYNACKMELKELWDNHCDEEVEDFNDWTSKLWNYYKKCLPLDGDKFSILLPETFVVNAKFKARPEWSKIEGCTKSAIVRSIMNYSIEAIGNYCGGTLYKGRRDTNICISNFLNKWIDKKERGNKKVLVLPSSAGISSYYFKEYLRKYTNNKETLLIKKPYISIRSVKGFMKKVFGVTTLSNPKTCTFALQVIKEFLKYVKQNVEIVDIFNSPEYQKFKKDLAKSRNQIAKVKDTGIITFTITDTTTGREIKYSCTLNKIVPWIKNEYGKTRIVYAGLDNPFIGALKGISYPNLIVLSTAKGKMKYLEDGGLPDYVQPIEALYSPDNRTLKRYATVRYLEGQITKMPYSSDVFPKHIMAKINALRNYMSKYSTLYLNEEGKSLVDVVPKEVYDYDILGLYQEVKDFIKPLKNFNKIAGGISYKDFVAYILMKKKKIRLDNDFYQILKNKIRNIIGNYESN